MPLESLMHTAILSVLLVLILCFAHNSGLSPSHASLEANGEALFGRALQIPTVANPTPVLSYVVLIVMEHRNYADIIGNSSAPYLNRLASNYGVAINYNEVSGNGPLPNYLGLVAANTYDSSWSTCNTNPLTCSSWPLGGVTDPTIVDRLEGTGLTWKAYMENYPGQGSPGGSYSPGGCFLGDTSGTNAYVARHNPFVWFAHIINNSTECAKVVPAGTNDAALVSDLSSMSLAPNFMWLTPNLCNDTGACSTAIGDSYLSLLVPQILSSPIFQSQKAALFVTWSQGRTSAHITSIWSGAAAKNNYTSSFNYNHYSFLKTIETVWSLSSLTSNDAGVPPMTEFFRSQSNGSVPPHKIGLGSWNPHVPCTTPWIVRLTDITDNMTGPNSYNNSSYSHGISGPAVDGPNAPKRWLTPGVTPPSWVPPGPSCSITNLQGQVVASFVEVDGIARANLHYETDCSTSYDAINGGTPEPLGHWCDDTFNIYDPSLISNYPSSCASSSDPTCFARIHLEFDHDWMAAGYCGPSTTYCNNNTLAQQTIALSANTLFDVQGFIYWDPVHVNEQEHSFSGWELHPLTAWRLYKPTVMVQPKPLNLGLLVNGTGTSTVMISSVDGFSGTVNIFVSQGPFNANCPPSVSISKGGNATVACGFSSSRKGNYTVTIGAYDSSNKLLSSANVLLTVGDLAITTTPASMTVSAGQAQNLTVTLTSLQGFFGNVTAIASPSPGGLPLSPISKSIILTTGMVVRFNITISPTTSTPTGIFTVNVTASLGGVSRVASASVNVTSPSVGGRILPTNVAEILIPYLEGSLLLVGILTVVFIRSRSRRHTKTVLGMKLDVYLNPSRQS